MDSSTMRFISLCQEAIKVAEEGAIAAETCNIVLKVLKKAAKEVAVMKKSIARVSPSNTRSIVTSQEDTNKTPTLASDLTMNAILWPWQNGPSNCSNLNNSSFPVDNLNQQGTASVCINCDSGTPDIPGVLTCFKSMTWIIEANDCTPPNNVAVVNLKLQDTKTANGESEVKFQVSKALGSMLKFRE